MCCMGVGVPGCIRGRATHRVLDGCGCAWEYVYVGALLNVCCIGVGVPECTMYTWARYSPCGVSWLKELD